MAIKERMSGNEAVSYAIRQVNPDVFSLSVCRNLFPGLLYRFRSQMQRAMI